MKWIRKLSDKIMVRGESWELTHRIHNEFIDYVFHGSFVPILLALIATTVLYSLFLKFDHDDQIHIWYFLTISFYLVRMGILQTYLAGRFLFFRKRNYRISSGTIICMGACTGMTWLYLSYAVLLTPLYPLISKIIFSSFMMLFTFAALFLYCMIPLWCLSYVFVLFVPISIYLFLMGPFEALCGFSLLSYVSFLLSMSYRTYKIHFKALYMQYQNEQYVHRIDHYNYTLERLNEDLKRKNSDLRGEIQKRRRAEKKIKTIASRDSLTGVTNRVSLGVRMNRVFRQANRTGTLVGIVFLDFDRFKLINDTFGHHIGDELLKSVANRLVSIVRSTDEIFRIGGDEFVILLTNIDRQEAIPALVALIFQSLEIPHRIGDRSIVLRASIGISIYPNHGLQSDDLLKYADLAMYQSKECGGNSYTIYGSEMK